MPAHACGRTCGRAPSELLLIAQEANTDAFRWRQSVPGRGCVWLWKLRTLGTMCSLCYSHLVAACSVPCVTAVEAGAGPGSFHCRFAVFKDASVHADSRL